MRLGVKPQSTGLKICVSRRLCSHEDDGRGGRHHSDGEQEEEQQDDLPCLETGLAFKAYINKQTDFPEKVTSTIDFVTGYTIILCFIFTLETVYLGTRYYVHPGTKLFILASRFLHLYLNYLKFPLNYHILTKIKKFC